METPCIRESDGCGQDCLDFFLARPVVKTANIQKRESHYKFSKHIHDNLEIYFIISGFCGMDIGRQAIQCGPGDFVLILPNIPHSFYLCGENTCEFKHIHFSPRLFSEMKIFKNGALDITLLRALEFAAAYGNITCHFQADSFLKNRISKIIEEMDQDAPLSTCYVNLHLTETLLHILEFQNVDFSAYSPSHKVQNDYVNFALDYIRGNFDNKFRIEDIAAKLNISTSYLRRIFTECMHINLSGYIQVFRINKAIDFMMNTDMSLTEIAIASGLNDAQYFSRLFRNTIGISPLKYRKLRQVEID